MQKLDLGRIGRGYVAGLWLAFAAIFLIGGATRIYGYSTQANDQEVLKASVVILIILLVHGVSAWGLFRRRFWGYCSSLVISAYWIVDSAYGFFPPYLTAAPRWFSAIPFVLNAMALAWLASPALRSQFKSPFRDAKVETLC